MIPENDKTFSKIAAGLQALKNGKMILVKDDDDREGEGDLIAAANTMSEQAMAFMIRHTSGIICAPLTGERAKQLGLYEMVPGQNNDAPHQTAFTISVDAKQHVTTGISAKERLQAVRLLAAEDSQADDFVRPGHVFPLIAKRGGVLTRAGHTEAAVDLMALAGLPHVGVIGELVNDDGTVKKGEELIDFAKEHNLPILTIDEIISYRQDREQLLTLKDKKNIDIVIGGKKSPATLYTYQSIFDDVSHYALVFGDASQASKAPTLTRLHIETMPDDIFNNSTNDLNQALEILSKDPESQQAPRVLVYLRRGAVGVESNDAGNHADNNGGKDDTHQNSDKQRKKIWREIGLGAQMLKQLGITSLNLLAHHEKQYLGLAGFGLTIEKFTKF